MLHFFFSVHLTIYRSAKSQPSSLRLELITCSSSDLSCSGKVLDLLISLSTKHPNTRQSHRFGLTFRANLSHIVFFFFKKVHFSSLKWIQ